MKAIKHLVRTVSANPNPMSGSDSVGDVERELAVYFEGGWELYSVQVIGSSAGNVTMLYVLTKQNDPMIVPLEQSLAYAQPTAKRGRPAKVNTETTEV
jgi:hypothetical protein